MVRNCLWLMHLLVQLGLDGVEQVPIDDGRLLARKRLSLEEHFSDVKPIAKQMGERAAGEGDAADGFTRLQGPRLGDDALLAEVVP